MLDGGIGYVHIANFDRRCAEETHRCIDELLAQDAKGIIFDVRLNGGGYKDELVKVLDRLLPEGILFQSEDYSGKKEIDRSDAEQLSLPMAVLVNQDSYSAAEFFAAALQEYGAADDRRLPGRRGRAISRKAFPAFPMARFSTPPSASITRRTA